MWTLCAQTVSVSGTLLIEGNEPLQLVNVTVDSLGVGTITNLDGQFRLELPPGGHKISVRAIGFMPFDTTVAVGTQAVENLVFRLRTKEHVITEAVVIKARENPANRIIRNASKNRDKNRLQALDNYSCEVYTKTAITLNNITEEKLNSALWLRPARDFLRELKGDSAVTDSNNRYKLGLYLTEEIKQVEYHKPRKKELVVARKTTGIESNESTFLTTLLANVDVYDNNIVIMEKAFLSPIATASLLNYRFYLFDTVVYGADSVFGMNIVPRNKYDPLFTGKIYIESGSWAVKKVDLWLASDPNINFVENVRVRQEYDKIDTLWIPVVRDIEVDFKNQDDKIGVIGRTVTFNTKYKLDVPTANDFFRGEAMDIAEDADKKDSLYWVTNRASALEKSDKAAYRFIEQLKKRSIWKLISTINQFFTTGKKRLGPIDIGPYSKLVGFNQVEGVRVQFGVYTNFKFSERWYFGAQGAYGFKDKRFKYDVEAMYRFVKRPRLDLGFSRTQEVEQVGFKNYDVDGTGLLNTLLMRVPLTKLNYYTDNTLRLRADILRNVYGIFYLKTYNFTPAPTFPYFYQIENKLYSVYRYAETGFSLRISFKEEYVWKQNEKIYLPTPIPKFYVDYNYGIKGLLGGQFEYHKVSLSFTGRLKSSRFGWANYTVTVGQIFGTLPYPSLYVFTGNQSYVFDPNGYYWDAALSFIGSNNRSTIYDGVGFNLMYYYEFCADRYAVGAMDYHGEGWIFNKIPGWRWLMKKLKWRETASFRIGWGSLTEANRAMNSPAPPNPELIPEMVVARAPDGIPYMEVGAGLENIFRIFRIDFIWRLSYFDPQAPGRLAKFNYNFGFRVNANISF